MAMRVNRANKYSLSCSSATSVDKILYCAYLISLIVFFSDLFTAALDFSRPRTAVLRFLTRIGISVTVLNNSDISKFFDILFAISGSRYLK